MPAAIFFVCSGAVTLSFIFLSFIRLPNNWIYDTEEQSPESEGEIGREETLVDESSIPAIVVNDLGGVKKPQVV